MAGWTLRLKRHYSIVAHSPDVVEVRHGVWNPESYTLRDESGSGRLYRVIRRLDGTAPPSQIAREEDVPLEDVEGVVDHLQGLGLLESGPTTALDYYLDTIVPWRHDHELAAQSVTLLGDADLTGPIAEHLRRSLPDVTLNQSVPDDLALRRLSDISAGELNDGLAFEEAVGLAEPWRGSFVVHASNSIDPVALRVLNRICMGLEAPWLHAALDGPFILVGPVIIPQRSACYECLETRVLMNMRERTSYLSYKEALAEYSVVRGALPDLPILAGILAGHVALEAVNFLATGSTFTVNKLLAIYLPTMEIVYHEVLRVPSCPACGPVAESEETGLYFDTAALLQGAAGTDPGTA
jgi:bacteriocin biosynthesis cyclodehydratase domain-containing protein